MIRHHPSETTLLAFAAGTLAPLHARVVAAHLSICGQCANEISLMEAMGGLLLTGLPPVSLAPDALEHALARLDQRPAPEVAPPSAPAARWRWCGPGVYLMSLARRDGSGTRLDLIRVAPGTALLEHGHAGFETTVVLQGAFEDGTARYQVGDFSEADGAVDHQPRALPGDDCICMIATSGQLAARGLLGRLVRPLLGM